MIHLLIPPHGLLEVIEAEEPVDEAALLLARGAVGPSVRLRLEADGIPVARLDWQVDATVPLNPRARQAVTELGDIHMLFTGPVLFSEIEREKVGELVALLSVKGS